MRAAIVVASAAALRGGARRTAALSMHTNAVFRSGETAALRRLRRDELVTTPRRRRGSKDAAPRARVRKHSAGDGAAAPRGSFPVFITPLPIDLSHLLHQRHGQGQALHGQVRDRDGRRGGLHLLRVDRFGRRHQDDVPRDARQPELKTRSLVLRCPSRRRQEAGATEIGRSAARPAETALVSQVRRRRRCRHAPPGCRAHRRGNA